MAKVGKVTKIETLNWLASAKDIQTFTKKFTLADAPAADANGRRIYKSGSPYPANDATGVGLVYNDVDVTDGDCEGALCVQAWVLAPFLPVTLTPEFLGATQIHIRPNYTAGGGL